MNPEMKQYIDSLSPADIPFARMFTAYGTAENYPDMLDTLMQTDDEKEWNRIFKKMHDFEHQSTLFPPAPFVMVFLVRILEKHLKSDPDGEIVKTLLRRIPYYLDIIKEAESLEHAEPLAQFADMLDEQYLLPENCTEDDLEEIFEDPDAVPDNLFYSFYYYSKAVLSQVPAILDTFGLYPKISAKLKKKL